MIALGLISTVGALVMTGPRVYEAMGRDFHALRLLGVRSGERGPVFAITVQATLSAVMIVTATFDALLTYIGFTLSLFAFLTVLGVFVLRLREPSLPRPYRTWGHPVTSVAFLALTAWMVAYTASGRSEISLVGLGTLLAGGLLYLLVRRGPRRGGRPGD
jgi:APA family basic amino acid/polyamine antiporter